MPCIVEIREGHENADFDWIQPALASTYWSPGVSREKVERAAANSSLVVSAFLEGRQVGYLRVVSDKTTFGWIADVFVDPGSRGLGIAQSMVNYALEHPEHKGLRRWVLASISAQGVYEKCGFKLIPNPEAWMIIGA